MCYRFRKILVKFRQHQELCRIKNIVIYYILGYSVTQNVLIVLDVFINL